MQPTIASNNSQLASLCLSSQRKCIRILSSKTQFITRFTKYFLLQVLNWQNTFYFSKQCTESTHMNLKKRSHNKDMCEFNVSPHSDTHLYIPWLDSGSCLGTVLSAGCFAMIWFLREKWYLVLLITFSRKCFWHILSLLKIIFMIISTNWAPKNRLFSKTYIRLNRPKWNPFSFLHIFFFLWWIKNLVNPYSRHCSIIFYG